MNDERLEDLLRERGRTLDGPVLSDEDEARLRAQLAQRAALEASAPGARAWRPRTVWLTAAAALVLVALGFLLQRGSKRGVEARVAMLESAALISEYREIYDLDPARLPDVDRGASTELPPPAEILDYATDAEQRAVERALAAEDVEMAAAWFKVAFVPDEDCSAVVLRIDPDGSVRRGYPDSARRGSAPNRFAAGRTHVLPGASVQLVDAPGGAVHEYESGFVRPRSVDRLVVVLGLRGRPFDAELERALDGFLAGLGGDAEDSRVQVLGWLANHGFSVQERIVVAGR